MQYKTQTMIEPLPAFTVLTCNIREITRQIENKVFSVYYTNAQIFDKILDKEAIWSLQDSRHYKMSKSISLKQID